MIYLPISSAPLCLKFVIENMKRKIDIYKLHKSLWKLNFITPDDEFQKFPRSYKSYNKSTVFLIIKENK